MKIPCSFYKTAMMTGRRLLVAGCCICCRSSTQKTWWVLFDIIWGLVFPVTMYVFSGTHSKSSQRVCKDLDCKKSELAKGKWERFAPIVIDYSLSPEFCWFPCHLISSSSTKDPTPVGSTKLSTENCSLLEAALAFDLIRAE